MLDRLSPYRSDMSNKEAAKAAAFERVIAPRVNRALAAIGLIEAGGGRPYSCTPERATLIVNQLSAAVAVVAEAFGLGRPPPHPFAEDAEALGVTRHEAQVSAFAAAYGGDPINPGDPEYTPEDYAALPHSRSDGEPRLGYVAWVRAQRAANAVPVPNHLRR
jgi:hypothetical protein